MFRGKSFTYRDGWFVRTPENGNSISYMFSATAGLLWRHVFPGKPKKDILAAFNRQAKDYGHSKARINGGNAIIYPNLGEDFYCRRLACGWQGATEEIQGFIELLMSFWPYQVVLGVKLSDLVIDESGRVLCVDWKGAIVSEKKVIKTFPSTEAYEQYIIECLQGSWLDFLRKHGDEINLAQKRREEVYGEPHVERPSEILICRKKS